MPVIIAGCLAASAALGWWLFRHRYAVITVRGESMSPTYRHGDRLLIRRTSTVRSGDCVVYSDKTAGRRDTLVVKRAVEVSGRQMLVLGDNPGRSYDSRHFGRIDVDRVRGVVLRRMSD
jgi:signal peptidase I